MKLLSVALLDLKKELKEPKMFIIMLVLPLFFTFVMGLAYGGNNNAQPKINVALVDEEKGFLGLSFRRALKGNESLAVKEMSLAAAKKLVREKKTSSAVVIPAGSGEALKNGKKVSLPIIALPSNTDAQAVAQIVEGVGGRLSSSAKTASYALARIEAEPGQERNRRHGPASLEGPWMEVFKTANGQWDPEPPVKTEYVELKADVENKVNQPSGFAHTSMGFTVVFVMFTVVFGAGAMLQEREKGTLVRLLSCPVRPWSILGGHLLGAFIIGWAQLLILIMAGKYLFGVDWGRNIPALIVFLSVYLFCVAGLGMLISSLVRTTAQLQAISPIVMVSMAMVGGAYWPVEITPQAMQVAAKLVPTGWVMTGLKDLIARGSGFEAIWTPAAVLLGMGAVFFAVGVKFTRFE